MTPEDQKNNARNIIHSNLKLKRYTVHSFITSHACFIVRGFLNQTTQKNTFLMKKYKCLRHRHCILVMFFFMFSHERNKNDFQQF